MKRSVLVCVLAIMLVLTGTISADAVTIDDPNNGETHLYQIFQNSLFNGGVYANSQDIANTVPILETLPAGLQNLTVTAYAKFASFIQNPGFYTAGDPNGRQYFSPKGFTNAFPTSGDGIFSITDWPTGVVSLAAFGFFDDTTDSGGDIKFTELALNSGGLSQSNGLIFRISPSHYIVAFEDGGGARSLGDMDYNDLVLNVVTSPVPESTTILLFGSGLFGLWGARKKLKK